MFRNGKQDRVSERRSELPTANLPGAVSGRRIGDAEPANERATLLCGAGSVRRIQLKPSRSDISPGMVPTVALEACRSPAQPPVTGDWNRKDDKW
jgi:hypothetical protein